MSKRDEEKTEQVRLISRDEGNEAIRSGEAVKRERPSGGGDDSIDLRDEHVDSDTVTRAHETLDLGLDSDGGASKSAGDEDRPSLMPHWTDPPTSQIPRISVDDETDVAEQHPEGPRWRTSHDDWKASPDNGLSDLGRASALGGQVSSDDDDHSAGSTQSVVGDEPAGRRFRESASHTEPVEPSVNEGRPYDRVSVFKRVVTAGFFAVAALGAFAAGPPWILTLCSVVLLLAAVEYFDGLRRVGFRPATLLALLAVAGCLLGGYARGEQALPLVLAMAVVFTFLWYLTGIIKESPTANIAVTLLGVVWIGVLGSYAALLLRQPNGEGVAFLLGAVLLTIAYDTAAYVGGSMFGKHKLAPSVSPSKTWEGLAAGTVATALVAAFGVAMISPWSVVDAVLLGLVVSVVAPIGDFAESLIKRDLGIKDMGRILPGHGGVLDRFDALLLVLPATYYLVLLLNV